MTVHDETHGDLSTVVGVLGVRGGGAGADMRTTGGPGHVVKQSSVGAPFTTGPVSAADFRDSGAYSVVGNASGASANVTDIAASANNTVLMRYSNALQWVPLPYYYIRATGSDQYAEFQAILDIAGAKRVIIGPGIFVVSQTPIMRGDTALLGMGKGITVLTLVPSVDGAAAIEASNGAAVAFRVEIGNMTIYTPDSTHQKDAVRSIDTSELYIHDISIVNWFGNNSVGLRIRGRDFACIERVTVNAANQAVSIDTNPHATISIDHLDMRDCLLVSDLSHPVIGVATGVNLTSCRMHGHSWIGGSSGFKWVDTTATVTSNILSIQDVRWEQHTAVTGYMVDLEHNYGMRSCSMTRVWNVQADGLGFKFRNVDLLSLTECMHDAATEALNVNGTVGVMKIGQTRFITGSTVTTTGMTKIKHEGPRRDNGDPLRPNEMWAASTNPNLAVALRVRDGSFGFFDDADETKVVQVNAANVATGTIRTLAAPNADVTLAGVLGGFRTTAVASTTAVTTEETLWTASLPAGTLNANGLGIRITASGSFAANANIKTVRFKFGGTTVVVNDVTTAPNSTSWSFTIILSRINSAAQYLETAALVGAVPQTFRTNSPAETLANAITCSITGQNGTASAADINLFRVYAESL